VIAIIALLTSILVPAMGKVKRQVCAILGAANQKEVVGGTTLYSMDNDDDYPESIATVGMGDAWNWTDPTKMTGNQRRTMSVHRAMSEYLGGYITDARVLFCPNAPRKYAYLQESWEAGDDWDNPATAFPSDPVTGTYCFYWNYTGYLVEKNRPFKGPSGSADGRGRSTLLVSDYFGYNHWRSPGCYGSCDGLKGASVVEETWLLSAYWSIDGDRAIDEIEVKPRAGYTDGHVESYVPSQTVTMKVAITKDGTQPYPDGIGAGDYYLPANSLR